MEFIIGFIIWAAFIGIIFYTDNHGGSGYATEASPEKCRICGKILVGKYYTVGDPSCAPFSPGRGKVPACVACFHKNETLSGLGWVFLPITIFVAYIIIIFNI